MNNFNDPGVSLYLNKTRPIDEAVWYNSTVTENSKEVTCVMILPYVTDKEDPQFMNWTNDKLAFDSLESATKFCEVLNVPLVSAEILEELEIYPEPDQL